VEKNLSSITSLSLETKLAEKYLCQPQKIRVLTEYWVEDLMNDIHTKFYYPLSFLGWLFIKKHPKLKKETLLITIDPSYESPTNYNMTLYEQKIVLLQNLWKAWSFWFKDEKEFEYWVDECLGEMEEGLKKWRA
jgi:hypothetical protein